MRVRAPHTRTLAALMLAIITSALLAPLALAQEDLQGTLDAYTPEDAPGGGATREWTAEWPHHPSQAEIDDAIARIPEEHLVWSANEMGEWERFEPLTVDKATPYKVHSKSGAADLGGDSATGDHLFVHYEGTLRDLGQWDDLATIAPEGTSERIDLPYNRVARLSWDKTGQRFFVDDIVPLTPFPATIDDIYAAGYLPGWVSEGAADTEAPLPWKTVTGGALAVAAAAAAMAGSFASARGKGEKIDPNKPIGYILDLSTPRIELTSQQAATLEVKVHRVLASGQTELVAGAPITLSAPAGVQVSPASGAAPLVVQVWQDGEPGPGASLTVSASAEGGGTQARVELVPENTSELVLSVVPAGAKLKPTGRDAVMVSAEIKPSALASADPNVDLASAKKSIAFSQPTSAEWLDVGKPTDTPVGKEMPVSVSSPDPNRQLAPPESITVSATATLGAKQLSASVTIGVEKPPVIDIRPDVFECAADSKASLDVFAWIENHGGLEWTFTAKWKDGDRPLATFEITPQTPSTAAVAVTENAGNLPDTGFAKEASTLVITGTADGWDPLERYLKVIVSREGLFIDPTGRDPEDGAYHVLADGSGTPADIDVRVYVRDAEGLVRRDDSLASAVEFTITDEPGSRARNAAETGNLSVDFAGLREIEPPSATWKATVSGLIPADAPLLPVRFLVTVPGQADTERFEKPLTLGLEPSREAPGGPDWQIEYDRCKEIILEFVPSRYQPDLMRILERRGKHLGADGLFALRHQIWGIAQELTLGEGGEGYRDVDKWASRITTVLEYAEWAGDLAFSAALGALVGPWAALGIGELKTLIVSAIVAYEEDKTPDQWLWDNVGSLPVLLEGQAVDVDKFSKFTKNNKAKAWAYFVAYHFFKNYLYNGKSFTDSLVEAGRQARDEAIATWLGEKVKESANAGARPEVQRPKQPAGTEGGTKDSGDADAEGGGSAKKPKRMGTPAERAKAMLEDIAAKTKGGKKLDAKTVMEIMTDPDAMREVKKASPEAWAKVHAARKVIYREHDKQLKAWIKENVPDAEGHDVVIESFGTPDGIDRDYRAGIVYTDPNTGRKMFVEIKKEVWAGESQKIFAEQTGGPADPEGAAKWAKEHQQLATDQYHAEASVDMADQMRIYNEKTGRWETVQVEPRVNDVKAGRAILIDPEGLGNTYKTKVAEAYYEGNQADAYKQADKAVHTLEGVREGYAKQGYGVKDIPPTVLDGIDAIKDVQSGKISVADAEKRLKDLKFEGGLPGFMQSLSGQLGAFKWARKA